MVANGYLQTLVACSAWANDRVRQALGGRGLELYAQEVGGSCPSLHATFVHIYGAERLWFRCLSAEPGTADAAGYLCYLAPPARRGAAVGWWGIANNLAGATGPSEASDILGGYGYGAAGAMGALAAVLRLAVPRAGRAAGGVGATARGERG